MINYSIEKPYLMNIASINVNVLLFIAFKHATKSVTNFVIREKNYV